MKTILMTLLIGFATASYSQSGLDSEILAFYENLNKGDKHKVEPYFDKHCSITHHDIDTVITYSLKDFSTVYPKFKSGTYQEEITKIELVSWGSRFLRYEVFFDFFVDSEYTHSGIDELTFLANNKMEYKINKIYSTIVDKVEDATGGNMDSSECESKIDMWHRDVAEFELEDYFDFMHPEFIFLGTDPKERWTKMEFYKFCKPYFDKNSTWDFKVNWRNTYQKGNVIWFEESLDTWMKECRGSGVAVYENNQWQLIHYNLTVLIENKKVQKFIKLREKK